MATADRRRIALETWSPAYGTSADVAVLEQSDVTVDPHVELAAKDWRPVTPSGSERLAADHEGGILFIDGVRRIDAYAWITENDQLPFRAMFASYAAGAVLADLKATVVATEIRRILVASTPTTSLSTRAGTWVAVMADGDSPEEMSSALQARLTDLEIDIARAHAGRKLIVIDGPLRGRQDIPGATGYVKTHQVAYLPRDLHPVVAALAAGQRTPIFRCTTSWSRYSWYLRLPGPANHAWWGVVRLEASEHMELTAAIALADTTAATLPKFASAVHKDPRAPQNLFPIGGLESELRHRLGDAAVVERLLRARNV